MTNPRQNTSKLLGRARAMRKQPSDAEHKLWQALRGRRLDGLKFRSQVAIGPFTADFACDEFRLIVEIDGRQHDENVAYDEARTKKLNELGWAVTRFYAGDVVRGIDTVCRTILDNAKPHPNPLPAIPGEGTRAAMRILGIDPGLQLCGYGVIDFDVRHPRLVDGGVIRLNPKHTVAERLVEIEKELDAILIEHKPRAVAVEQLYAHYAHPRTAIVMGHARGVLLLVAQRRGLAIHEYPANRVKKNLTGNGHAKKEQMQAAVQALWNLPAPPEPPDVADALAVALCCGRELMTR